MIVLRVRIVAALLVVLCGCTRDRDGGPRIVPQVGVVEARRVQWSPREDGVLLVMEVSGRVGIWDVSTPSAPYLFASMPAAAIDAGFTPDGRMVVTAGFDGRVRWWTPDGRAIAVSKTAHSAAARAVAMSGDEVVSGGEEGMLRVWRADGSAVGEPLAGHKGPVVSVAIAPNGDIASVGADGTLRRWKPSGQSPALVFEPSVVYRQASPPNPVAFVHALQYDVHWGWDHSVAFSPRGDVLAGALFDGAVRLWNADGSLRSEIPDAHGKRAARALAFSPQGDILASTGFDGQVRLWNLDGSPHGNPILAHQDAAYSVSFSARGDRLASAGADDLVRLWSLDGKRLGELPHAKRDAVATVAVASHEPLLAVAGSDSSIQVRQLDGTPRGGPIAAPGSRLTALACSAAGETLASGAVDGSVRIYAVDGTARGEPQNAARALVGSLAFVPAGDRIASGSDAVRLLRFDGIAWEGPVSTDPIAVLAFSPGADLIAAGSLFGRLQLWNLNGSPHTAALKLAKENIVALAFAPDGMSFASAGGQENVIRLWNLDGTPHEPPLEGHRGVVTALASSPDTGVLASGSADGVVRLWRLPAREFDTIDVGLPVDQIGFERRLLWVRAGRDSIFFYDAGARLVATAQLLADGLVVVTPDGWFSGSESMLAAVRGFAASGATLSAADVRQRRSAEQVERALARAAGDQ